MLAAGTIRGHDIDNRAAGIVADIKHDLAVSTTGISISGGREARRGCFLRIGVSSAGKWKPAGAAANRTSLLYFFAVDVDVIGQGDVIGVENRHLQLRGTRFRKRVICCGAIAGSSVAHPKRKIVPSLHDQIAATEAE